MRLDATTRNDGAVVITAAGNATSAGLERALNVDVVQRLLDRSQGACAIAAR